MKTLQNLKMQKVSLESPRESRQSGEDQVRHQANRGCAIYV
jgi:hypothetical protein